MRQHCATCHLGCHLQLSGPKINCAGLEDGADEPDEGHADHRKFDGGHAPAVDKEAFWRQSHCVSYESVRQASRHLYFQRVPSKQAGA
jgi:hypothetical protein